MYQAREVPSHNEDCNGKKEKGNDNVNIEVGRVWVEICQCRVTKVDFCALQFALSIVLKRSQI